MTIDKYKYQTFPIITNYVDEFVKIYLENKEDINTEFQNLLKVEIDKEILKEKWKARDYNTLTEEERKYAELSMSLEPFTSDEAERIRGSNNDVQ